MATPRNEDEFDRWLSEGAAPAPAAAEPSAASKVSSIGGGWFSGLVTKAASLAEGADALFPSEQPLQRAVPGGSGSSGGGGTLGGAGASASSLFSSVAGRLRATIEDNVSQLKQEAELYCTEEAQRAEKERDAQLVAEVTETVAHTSQTLARAAALVDVSIASAPTSEPAPAPAAAASAAPWLDAPPQLRVALERAVLALSESTAPFLEPLDMTSDADVRELTMLLG